MVGVGALDDAMRRQQLASGGKQRGEGEVTVDCWLAAGLFLPDHENSYHLASHLYALFSFNKPFLHSIYPHYLQAATKIYRLQTENPTSNGGEEGDWGKW